MRTLLLTTLLLSISLSLSAQNCDSIFVESFLSLYKERKEAFDKKVKKHIPREYRDCPDTSSLMAVPVFYSDYISSLEFSSIDDISLKTERNGNLFGSVVYIQRNSGEEKSHYDFPDTKKHSRSKPGGVIEQWLPKSFWTEHDCDYLIRLVYPDYPAERCHSFYLAKTGGKYLLLKIGSHSTDCWLRYHSADSLLQCSLKHPDGGHYYQMLDTLHLNSSAVHYGGCSDLIIYKEFVRGGTTASVLYQFYYGSYKDTSPVEHQISDSEIDKLLSDAKCTKLRQQKLAGISFGGEVTKDGSKHYIAICLPDCIYDFTAMKKYLVSPGDMPILQKLETLQMQADY